MKQHGNSRSRRFARLGGLAIALLAGAYLAFRLASALVLGPELRSVLRTVPSPDGRLAVYVVAVDRGGATVGFSYEVIVHPAVEPFDAATDTTWVWRSYKIEPDKLFWQGSDIIHVPIDQSYKAYFGFIKTRSHLGVTAVTDFTKP